MGKLKRIGILPVVSVVAALYRPCHAQVYSQNIYSGGVSYMGQTLFDIPVPPYHYMAEETGRYEDADGLVIMDLGHEKQDGGVYCRYIDVQIGPVSYSVWLDREPPLPARKRAAEEAERERRLQANLDSGFFQVKTYVMNHWTDSESNQLALFSLEDREKFPDGGWIRGTQEGTNILTITASTNDMVIWDRVVNEFNNPSTK